MALSPDNKHLASASGDLTVRLWELPTGQHINTLTGHKQWPGSVSFSPDGKTLASASPGSLVADAVRLWDVQSGKVLKYLPGNYVIYHPYAHELVTAIQKDIRIWQLDDPVHRLFYDFDPKVVAPALKFLWQFKLEELDFVHAKPTPSLLPQMEYFISWTDENRQFRPLLDIPKTGESKLEQLVRWLEEQQAYRKSPAGMASN